MIMLILAILAVVAIERMTSIPAMRIDLAARQVQSDIRYAQSLAMSIQKRTRMDFNAASDNYSLYFENSPGNWSLIADPLTKDNFIVQLNSDEFSGIDITAVYFNAADRALVFDKWGNPYSYDAGSDTAAALANTSYVRLSANSGTKDIVVERGAGRAYTQ